jgi:hypothetical protein
LAGPDVARFVASLDVLDYLHGLDDELAKPGADGKPLLPASLRGQARKDVRRVLDAMAFRFAILDERPLPEDLDYLRAIEALQPAPKAAAVLARRRPFYAKTRRRRLASTWTTLAVIGLALFALVWFGTSEKAETLVAVKEQAAVDVTYIRTWNFTVDPAMNRLHIDGSAFLNKASQGDVEVFIKDPTGKTTRYIERSPTSNNWIRDNIEGPLPGVWQLVVSFNGASGTLQMTVDGVSPAR